MTLPWWEWEVEFQWRRHLIAGPLVVTWWQHTVSEAHPLVDPATVRLVAQGGPDDGLERRAGGWALRLWPVRTSRRTRQVTVALIGRRTPAPLRWQVLLWRQRLADWIAPRARDAVTPSDQDGCTPAPRP